MAFRAPAIFGIRPAINLTNLTNKFLTAVTILHKLLNMLFILFTTLMNNRFSPFHRRVIIPIMFLNILTRGAIKYFIARPDKSPARKPRFKGLSFSGAPSSTGGPDAEGGAAIGLLNCNLPRRSMIVSSFRNTTILKFLKFSSDVADCTGLPPDEEAAELSFSFLLRLNPRARPRASRYPFDIA